jgi:hypothetical protein
MVSYHALNLEDFEGPGPASRTDDFDERWVEQDLPHERCQGRGVSRGKQQASIANNFCKAAYG